MLQALFGCTRCTVPPSRDDSIRSTRVPTYSMVASGAGLLEDDPQSPAGQRGGTCMGATGHAYLGRKCTVFQIIAVFSVVAIVFIFAYFALDLPTSSAVKAQVMAFPWSNQASSSSDESMLTPDKASPKVFAICTSETTSLDKARELHCCEIYGTLCDPTVTTPPTPAPFTCDTGEVLSWPTSQREWCCKEQGIGCEEGCNAMCDFGGWPASCAVRIQHKANSRKNAAACVEAFGKTIEECPSCSVCRLADAKCEVQPDISLPDEDRPILLPTSTTQTTTTTLMITITSTTFTSTTATSTTMTTTQTKTSTTWTSTTRTWTTTTTTTWTTTTYTLTSTSTPPATGCNAVCEIEGRRGQCSAHMQYIAIMRYEDQADACIRAHSEVGATCRQCGTCDIATSGCSIHTTSITSTSTTTWTTTTRTTTTRTTTTWTTTTYTRTTTTTLLTTTTPLRTTPPMIIWTSTKLRTTTPRPTPPMIIWTSTEKPTTTRAPTAPMIIWTSTKLRTTTPAPTAPMIIWTSTEKPTTTTRAREAPPLPMDIDIPESTSRGCNEVCTMDGNAATCTNHVLRTATETFPGSASSCAFSFGFVIKQCPSCTQCSLGETGCTARSDQGAGGPATTSQPFDCFIASYSELSNWPKDKRDWCCAHKGAGCAVLSPPTPRRETTTRPALGIAGRRYDCEEDADTWLTTWTTGKRDWCCDTYNVGCL
mmetsp:Transcript_45509/g.97545  ORF Transcript_45509/g.97545 Transcript_45509/m.97545 type:complete len:708 (-) Transcript_45509:44-2167(-)